MYSLPPYHGLRWITKISKNGRVTETSLRLWMGLFVVASFSPTFDAFGRGMFTVIYSSIKLSPTSASLLLYIDSPDVDHLQLHLVEVLLTEDHVSHWYQSSVCLRR